MGKRILIIGNGFDLAHGLPTKWIDFKKWLDEVIDRELGDAYIECKKLKELLEIRGLYEQEYLFWHDVEDALGKQYILCYDEENTEEKLKEIDELILLFSKIFEYYLVNVIDAFISETGKNSGVSEFLETIDEIVSFNFTTTLERVYHVERNKILYIHGRLDEFTNPLDTLGIIIGSDSYGEYLQSPRPTQLRETGISKSERVSSMFLKNPNFAIEYIKFQKESVWFDAEIFSWGFSFGDSDKYFVEEKINPHTNIIRIITNRKDEVLLESAMKIYEEKFDILDSEVIYNSLIDSEELFIEVEKNNLKKQITENLDEGL